MAAKNMTLILLDHRPSRCQVDRQVKTTAVARLGPLRKRTAPL
jgi:hypothetical protein